MSVMTDMIDALKGAGLDAYLPGRHQGPCLTAYVALEDGGVVRTGKTTGRHVYQLTAMVPVDRPGDMTRLLREIRAAMNTLPHLRAGDDSPDMIDEEKSAYCVTLEYSALCSA